MVMTELPTMRYLGLSGDMLGVSAHLFIVEKHHTTTTGGDSLVTIKADGTYLTKCTCVLAFVFRANALSSILNQFNMPLFAKSSNLFNTNRMTKGMHRYASLDSAASILVVASILILLECEVMALIQFIDAGVLTNLCILLEPFLHGIRRKTHRRTVNINEYRMSTNIAQCITGGNEGQCLCQHFVITLHAHEHQAHVKGIGTAYTYHSTFCACVCSHILLKAVNELTYRTNECSINTLVEIFLLVTNKLRNSKRSKLLVAVQILNKTNYVLVHISSQMSITY